MDVDWCLTCEKRVVGTLRRLNTVGTHRVLIPSLGGSKSLLLPGLQIPRSFHVHFVGSSRGQQ